jgi:hypothetical protein
MGIDKCNTHKPVHWVPVRDVPKDMPHFDQGQQCSYNDSMNFIHVEEHKHTKQI